MELTPISAIKLLIFAVVPVCALALFAARRWLAPSNPIRVLLEKHGPLKIASAAVVVAIVCAGIAITLIYS